MKKKSLLLTFISLYSVLLFACTFNEKKSNISSPEISSSSSEEESISRPSDFVYVESITLPKSEYSLAYHKSMTVKPAILPVNATIKTVKWSSSNSEIISVNNTGYIYAWEIGEAILKCETTDGSKLFAEVKVTSYSNDVTDVYVNYATKDIYVGEKFTLEATVSPTNASFKDITFSSLNPDIATVDERGVVTGIKAGTAQIKAQSVVESVYAICTVTVSNIAVRGYSLQHSEVYVHVNETCQLVSRFVPVNASNRNVKYVSSNTNIATVDENGIVTGKSTGITKITATTEENGFKDECYVNVKNDNLMLKTPLNYTYKDYFDNLCLPMDCAPGHRETNFLIFPIWFTDSSDYIKPEYKESVRQDIEKGFFGTNEETGWRSVKTYYAAESFGKFKLGGMVTKWFECGMSSSRFATDNHSTVQLSSTCLEWFTSVYPNEDLKKYDADGNGYIDAIVMVYAAPEYTQDGNWKNQNLWAYCTWAGSSSQASIDNPKNNMLMWASYDFMYTYGNQARSKTGTYYGYGTSGLNIDTHTFIHESGHLLGLSDYYDYSNYRHAPAGGFSMQDHNVGGHDPYSLMAIGWVAPYIPTKSCDIMIEPFEKSGDLVLLTPRFNRENSPFDEYILLEYYTPTGNNERDSQIAYDGTGSLPKKPGIRIWHVDARLVKSNGLTGAKESDIVTCPVTDDGSKIYHAMSNTYYYSGSENISPLGRDFADYNILQIIRNDTTIGTICDHYLRENEMFYAGDTFSLKLFNKQFVKKNTLNNGRDFNWTVEIEDIDSNYASIKLTLAA